MASTTSSSSKRKKSDNYSMSELKTLGQQLLNSRAHINNLPILLTFITPDSPPHYALESLLSLLPQLPSSLNSPPPLPPDTPISTPNLSTAPGCGPSSTILFIPSSTSPISGCYAGIILDSPPLFVTTSSMSLHFRCLKLLYMRSKIQFHTGGRAGRLNGVCESGQCGKVSFRNLSQATPFSCKSQSNLS